jgi:hypothetical protein
MSSVFDQHFAQLNDDFLSIFGEEATYFAGGQAGQPVTAIFEDRDNLDRDNVDGLGFNAPLARFAEIWLKMEDAPDLAYQDQIRRESDQVYFVVREPIKLEAGLWHIYASTVDRGGYNR